MRLLHLAAPVKKEAEVLHMSSLAGKHFIEERLANFDKATPQRPELVRSFRENIAIGWQGPGVRRLRPLRSPTRFCRV
jgi:hypothetical protein